MERKQEKDLHPYCTVLPSPEVAGGNAMGIGIDIMCCECSMWRALQLFYWFAVTLLYGLHTLWHIEC
jgi:hypothetical protein